jgi:membrane-bound lytic murein transglycosylase B
MGALQRRHQFRTPLALALVLVLAGTTSSARHADSADRVSSPSADTRPGPASVTRIEALPYPGSGREVLAAPIRISATSASGQGRRARVDIADVLLAAYRSAAGSAPASCHLPVSLLAAIGQVESGSLVGAALDARHRASILGPVLDGRHGFKAVADTDNGRWDGNRRWDRAVGPLQFLPSTWRSFGVDGDGDGVADPQDVEDASATAAAYLCYGGRDLSQPATMKAAVLAYNASSAYEQLVLTYQQRYAALGLDRGVSVVGLSTAVTTGSPVAGLAIGELRTSTPAAPRGGAHPRTTGASGRSSSPGSGTTPSTATAPSMASGGGTSKPTATSAGSPPASPKPARGPGGSPGGSPSGGPTPTSSPTDDPTSCPPEPGDPAGASATPTADPTPGAPDIATCPPCSTDPGTTGQAPATPAPTPAPGAGTSGSGADGTQTCPPADPSATAASPSSAP